MLLRGQKPTLLVGNENVNYAKGMAQIELDVVLYQDFSLPDQDRSQNASLESLLQKAGLAHALPSARGFVP